jgi:hypothetical protein
MEPKAMNINLTPEQEKIVKEELKSGHFHSTPLRKSARNAAGQPPHALNSTPSADPPARC